MVGWLAATQWRLRRLRLNALTQALQHVGEVHHVLMQRNSSGPSHSSSDGSNGNSNQGGSSSSSSRTSSNVLRQESQPLRACN